MTNETIGGLMRLGDYLAGQLKDDVDIEGGTITNVVITGGSINGVGNSRNETIITAAGNYTVQPTDYVLTLNKTVPATTTITLPATPATSRTIIVKDGANNAGTFNATIDGNGKNIDGVSTLVLTSNSGAVELIYNGTQWNVLNKYIISGGSVTGPAGATANAVATYNGTTGSILQNSPVTITQSTGIIAGTQGVTMTGVASPTYVQGQIVYDTGNQCPTFFNDHNACSLQIGREVWERCLNNSGATIPNGAAVYVTGFDATSGLQTIALAKADAAATLVAIGLATESIANNAQGEVTCIGDVHGFDTSGFTAGDTVYVSAATAGALTNVSPVAPNFRYRIGKVGRSNATTGYVHVTPSTGTLGRGTANQVYGVNAAGTADEYKTITAGTNVTVTQGVGTITIAATGGGGGITGPGTTTSTALVRWNSTTGAAVQNSGILVDASNNTSGMGTLASADHTITSVSASALTVGANGATNPVLKVDASTTSVTSGLSIAGATGTTTVSAINSAADANLIVSAKGSGQSQWQGRANYIQNNGGTQTFAFFDNNGVSFTNTNRGFSAIPGFSYSGTAMAFATASVNYKTVIFDMSSATQHSTGAITDNYDFNIVGTTHTMQAASTITNAHSVFLSGAPIAGTNTTITNANGFTIGAAAVGASVTNSYGLTVNAQTGATNNFAGRTIGGKFNFAASTTGYAPINIGSGTAPTTPATGDIWFDGTNFVGRNASANVNFASGAWVQQKQTPLTTVATGTTITPWDNTIPQNTEGDQYMTVTITPTSSTNKLVIESIVNYASTVSDAVTIAIFQDTNVNALSANAVYATNVASVPNILSIKYVMVAGTTLATTFKIRVGNNSASTTTINGSAGAQKFGGVGGSILTVTEIAP